MLRLSVQKNEYIMVGKDVKITFLGGVKNQAHIMIDAPKEINIARVRAERRVQILHAQKILFTHGAHLFSFGSNASRRPSPNRFRLSTIRQIIRAGKISLYG